MLTEQGLGNGRRRDVRMSSAASVMAITAMVKGQHVGLAVSVGLWTASPEIRCPLELRVANALAGEFDNAGGVRPGMRICAGARTALPSRRCDRSTAIFRRASGGSPQLMRRTARK